MKKIYSLMLSLLALSMTLGNSKSNQQVFEKPKVEVSNKAKSESYSIDAGDTSKLSFTSNAATLLSSSDCVTQGVPEGYDGSVIKLTNQTTAKLNLNLSNANIKITSDLTLVFRIYAAATPDGKKPEFRFTNPSDASWAVNGSGVFWGDGGFSLATVSNQWYNLVIDSSNFINGASWSSFADADDSTKLGTITSLFRTNNTSDVFYLDKIYVGKPSSNDTNYLEFTNNEQFNIVSTSGSYPSGGELKFAQGNTFSDIPAGYEGAVLQTKYTSGNAGFLLDISQSDIDPTTIKSVKVKAAVVGGSTSDEFRTHNGTVWNTSYGVQDMTTWREYTLAQSSLNDLITNQMVAIVVRLKGASTTVVYFDSLTIELDTSLADFTKDEFKYTSLSGKAELLNEEAMASESVPNGYSDSVLKVYNSTAALIQFDYSKKEIPIGLVDSIVFRVCPTGEVSGKKPEFRLTPLNFAERGLSQWPLAKSTGTFAGDGGLSMVSVMNTWYDISIDSTTLDKNGMKNLASESDPSILGKFNIQWRCLNNTSTLYIDSVTLNLKANDGVGPVISGLEDNIHIPVRSKFVTNAKAFDEQENREIDLIETWTPTQTFDSNGRVEKQGNFQVTFEASDYYGNKSTKVIDVLVGHEDTIAPIINIPFTSISCLSGTVFNFDVDRYIIEEYSYILEITYSTGTFGRANRLNAGTHTMTIVATDSSGNSSTKVLTLIATGDYVDNGEVIYEGNADFDAVTSFCVNYLKKDVIALDDNSSTSNCSTNYTNAKTAFALLTESQKTIFVSQAEFASMLSRFQAWARANGEEIVIDGNNVSFVSMSNNVFDIVNSSNGVIYIVVISLVAFALLPIVIKKKKIL